VLFTELPKSFPPEREWDRLYLRDVQFDGYFLKVLRVDRPEESKSPVRASYIPVLVGRTVQLLPPDSVAATVPWQTILLAFLVALGVGTIAMILYRRSERRYLAKMAEVRRRVEQREDYPDSASPAESQGVWNPSDPPPADPGSYRNGAARNPFQEP
jgi:hypothetical protein